MARTAERSTVDFEKEALFFDRFVHDVLVYTLTKCGLPETSIPTTDFAENVYRDGDFVKVAGVSVLRVSLVMRDKWMLMFKSRRKSSGFTTKDVMELLVRISKCCPLSRENQTQALVELLLASCNEIMLYFHHENLDINFKNVVKRVGLYIVGRFGVYENDSVRLEDFFDNIYDISGYTEWITDFITEFALPYGSRDNVSDLFIERVGEQYKDYQKKLKDWFRYLPPDVFLKITDGSEVLAKSTATSSDSESKEPPKLPTGSEIGAVEGKSSIVASTCPENVSEQFSETKQSKALASEVGIEQDLEKMCLDVEETSQGTEGSKKKRKKSKKGKGGGKGSENLDEPSSIPSDSKSLEATKSPTDPKMGAIGGKQIN